MAFPSVQHQQQFNQTSGATDAVWVHTDPYSNRPQFSTLDTDKTCDVCVVGAGIAGISIAHELVSRGKHVILLEARTILSGETGRTSGHLANALDDHYTEIQKNFGHNGAKASAASHSWAIDHVGKIVEQLDIECEFRRLPGYEISQHPRGDAKHDKDLQQLQAETELASQLGIEATFQPDLAINGWLKTGPDQRGGAVFEDQAAFHPTKYLLGVLGWLQKQTNFQCYTHTRVLKVEDDNGNKAAQVQTESGHTIKCAQAVEATNIPLQKLAVVAQLSYNRTYCVAMRVPKDSVEDCFIYDSAEAYKYVRLTSCDDTHDYLIVGGCDHEVAHEPSDNGRFDELETWARERFPVQASHADYQWSGQILEPFDYMAYIGKNQGNEYVYIVTGDSGNGLTHGVIAGRLIADEIDGVNNPWASLYSPKRVASVVSSAGSILTHAAKINTQYKRFFTSDIEDIEDLLPGQGGVLNPKTGKPMAVYRDENGNVTKMSALCPHLKGVVCWNAVEKSFDCPVHGSRFSSDGVCVMGPAKANLPPVEA